ncbi:hypothetical protein QBC34DRAFT_410100 [Podospora aff. communis PSN243]|uniref:RelA/SpoT domain-containing protein n=1 Tax=Podospora aff. communis PSN243 TaxID=3040156 RepID=A0AAV9GHK6_9PEZI|nr:hypothetical protein QBC34DRAFT_410100 [Podospora aff. communis PSN243]
MSATTSAEASPFDDKAFSALVQEFTADYVANYETYRQRMRDVVDVLSNSQEGLLGCGIRHPPLSFRMKDVDSAVKSLQRRQLERLSRGLLKKLVEESGESWVEYCERWGERHKIEQVKPITTLDEAYEAVRDLAGVRVSLYFPGDVDRVRSFLKFGSRELVHVKTIHKTDRNPRVPSLERRIQAQIRKLGPKRATDTPSLPAAEIHVSRANTVFPGYDALHVIVKVSRDKLPALTGTPHRPGENMLIEVQVATAVMHAWQGVEHDVVYKNIGKEAPSEDQVRLIDLFNGIIMTGQVALRQLEETMKRQDTVRASKAAELVRHTWELEAVLAKFYESSSQRPLSHELRWTDLARLLSILKAARYQTVGDIKALLGGLEQQMHPDDSHFTECLPLRVLEHLCNILKPGPTAFLRSPTNQYSNAYGHALQLIQTLNMATYLDVAREFAIDLLLDATFPPRALCPSIADFLDILHPTQSKTNGAISDMIVDFCRWALKHDHHYKVLGEEACSYRTRTKLWLARELPLRSIVAHKKLATNAQIIGKHQLESGLNMLPSWLLTLLQPHRSAHSGELRRRRSGLSGGDHATSTQRGRATGLGYTGSSSLNQLQSYFCPQPVAKDDKQCGLWTLIGVEDLATWEVKARLPSDSTDGQFGSKYVERLETPRGSFYQDLAARLQMTLSEVYQVVEETKAWVQLDIEESNGLLLEDSERVRSGPSATHKALAPEPTNLARKDKWRILTPRDTSKPAGLAFTIISAGESSGPGKKRNVSEIADDVAGSDASKRAKLEDEPTQVRSFVPENPVRLKRLKSLSAPAGKIARRTRSQGAADY